MVILMPYKLASNAAAMVARWSYRGEKRQAAQGGLESRLAEGDLN